MSVNGLPVYRDYVPPYNQFDASSMLKLLQYIAGYSQPAEIVTQIRKCADTTFDASNPAHNPTDPAYSVGSIDATDALLHLRVLAGFETPRRSLP